MYALPKPWTLLSLVFTHKIRKKKMPTRVAYVSGIPL
jgi:hypothetical protein